MTSAGIEQRRQESTPARGVLGLPGRLPFTLRRFVPAADLDWCVEHFWTSSWDVAPDRVAVTRILPHPSVNLTLEDGELCVTGVSHGIFTRRLTGQDHVFGVKFRPGAFRLLTEVAITTLSGTGQTAHGLLPETHQLERSLRQATDDQQRVELVQTYLRGRDLRPDPALHLVQAAVSALVGDPDVHRVSDVSRRLSVSTRTLQRLFVDYVGVTPGWVLRRGRLHAAAEQVIALAAGGHPHAWPDLAADLGYADQAHFIRDFRTVLGVPPAQWADSLHTETAALSPVQAGPPGSATPATPSAVTGRPP